MSKYLLKSVCNASLLRRLRELVAHGNRITAELLAHIGEAEDRLLHLECGYDSMKAYLVGELNLSEDAAAKRVHAAHVARRHPLLFEALADGRIHLSAVLLLASSLTEENAGELIAAVTHKTNSQIREYLLGSSPQAEPLRFDVVEVVVPQQPIPNGHAPERVQLPSGRARVARVAPERYSVQVTMDAETHDKLRRIQALLGHEQPPPGVTEVLTRAINLMLAHLEKRKFAKVTKPRRPTQSSSIRGIAAHVKRAVYERDGGRCAYVGKGGHRCGSTVRLEFDHVIPVARGGTSTAVNLRLVCRAHNQFAAERTYGRNFMKRKRLLGERSSHVDVIHRGAATEHASVGPSVDRQGRAIIDPKVAFGAQGDVAEFTVELPHMHHEAADPDLLGHDEQGVSLILMQERTDRDSTLTTGDDRKPGPS